MFTLLHCRYSQSTIQQYCEGQEFPFDQDKLIQVAFKQQMQSGLDLIVVKVFEKYHVVIQPKLPA